MSFVGVIVSPVILYPNEVSVVVGQVNHLRALEKDNQKLVRRVETYEQQHANVEILKESNKTLEKKLRGMADLRQRIAAAEIEAEDLKREKKEWYGSLL